MRTWNFPEYARLAIGAGAASPKASISATASTASDRMPSNAFSGVSASHESEGISQRPDVFPILL